MGEFKKRLLTDRWDSYIWMKTETKPTIDEDEEEKLNNAINEYIQIVLEEAKKEFPKVFVPPRENEYWCNPREAAKWFERWFGEGSNRLPKSTN